MALNLYDPYNVTAQNEVATNKSRKFKPAPLEEDLTRQLEPLAPRREKEKQEGSPVFFKQNTAQKQLGQQQKEGGQKQEEWQDNFAPPSAGEFKGSGVSQRGPINNPFGAYNPADRYSGGVNYGVDIGVPRGTKLYAPPGEWVVVSAFNKATVEGPNNRQGGINSGYGNSVLLQNARTGEKLRMSHLRPGGVAVKPGMKVTQGDFLGETGATGNTAGRTGQHLDLEYYNQRGRLADPMATPYGKYYTGG